MSFITSVVRAQSSPGTARAIFAHIFHARKKSSSSSIAAGRPVCVCTPFQLPNQLVVCSQGAHLCDRNWAAASSVANANIRTTTFRLAFAAHKRLLAVALGPLVRRLAVVIGLDPWPSSLPHIDVRLKCGSMPIAFPTTRSGRDTASLPSNETFTIPAVTRTMLVRALSTCQGSKDTSAHNFWECLKAARVLE